MTGFEILMTAFSVYLLAGIGVNYNLIHATVRQRRPWRWTHRFNAAFHWGHTKLRWGLYVLSVLWYFVWFVRFQASELWFPSLLVVAYVATRTAAWFILSPRTAFLKRHKSLRSFGPSGTIAPLPDAYVLQLK